MYGACRLVLLRRVLPGIAFCAFGVLGLVTVSSASGYRWSPGSAPYFGTPDAACEYYYPLRDPNRTYDHLYDYSSTQKTCVGVDSNGTENFAFVVKRFDAGCASGEVWNDDSQSCANPCQSGGQRVFEEQQLYTDGSGELVIRVGSASNDQGMVTRSGPDGCGWMRLVGSEPISCYYYSEGSKAGTGYCAFNYVSSGTFTGSGAASGSGPSNDPARPSSNPPCSTASGGTIACSNPSNKQGEQCGTFNGHKVCVPSIPPSGCYSLGTTASSICGPSAPAPTDPSTGQPATPVDHIGLEHADSGGNTTITHTTIYNAGGSGSGTSSGTTGGTGQGGSGSGVGSGTGGDGIGEETCNPSADPDSCKGSGSFSGDDLGDVPSFGDSLNTFWTTVSSGGIVGAVSGLSFTDQAGECPKPVFTFFGKQYTMDAQCTIMASVGPTLDALVYAMWGLLGLFILLSA